jgi:peptidoglycan hydrolase-like protein with peptidoglycan-binding domain|tara:strand:+ start:977 stop:1840 length:864 start_codon:yes stop_codon:yes gene_type:complete
MRYSDFKIVETAPTDANDPRGRDQRNDPNAPIEGGLKAGPPYPPTDTAAVKALQSKLQDLGYSVGGTGVDGKYGPRTVRAVAAYKKDNNIQGDSGVMSAADVTRMSSATPVADPTSTGNSGGGSVGDLGDLASLENLDQATEVVSAFLGKDVSPEEMNMLIRATAAEASRNSQERGAVAAVILNRVRSSSYPNNIEAVLTQRNQFQAVTGTRHDPGPHSNFSNMNSNTGAQVIGAMIRYLPNMDRSWLNFTANNPRAYGRGTNIDFMYTMRNAPDAKVIGGTVFGTA